MRSFAAIATFATLAFSALTSALPTPGGVAPGNSVTNANNGLIPATVTAQDIANNLNHVVSGNQVNVLSNNNEVENKRDVADTVAGLIPRGGRGIPDVIVDVNAKVLVLIKDLTVKINADVDVHVALDLALKVFADIKVLIHAACVEIQAIVKADVSVALNLQGVVVDIKVFANILAQLVNAIVLAVALVVKICVSIDVSALLTIVADIVADLAIILGIVVKIAANIVVDLRVLLNVVVDLCVDLKLTALVKVFVNLLGITIKANISL
ncbi:hypothetical protein D9756_007025 [Leucocoprinus leucothites]|uniref:Uncharacterized protein n=1 Tax=Leucocoprinus leucothites TaxID=201217 RepID=A0A8H5D8I2_9AGAR|nr:hypothetical protein D9756_007025 [Leucoagaricus leucothites]